jgi:glycosyltransferase involved in cell wall biosynthesis
MSDKKILTVIGARPQCIKASAVSAAMARTGLLLWRKLIEGNQCGVCVNPHVPQSIARAIDYRMSNPELTRGMGENGRNAVLEKYNLAIQAIKLPDFFGAISHVTHTVASV